MSFQVCFSAFLLLSTVTAIHDNWNRTIIDDTEVRYLLQQERQRTILSEKSTCDNELCVPGKCMEVLGRATCFCPDGYVANGVKCVEIKRRCQRSFDCTPGQCIVLSDREVCLCPPGFISERGFCKEADRVCNKLDCKPGKCISEYGIEKCLCPLGFTAKDDKCIEISVKVPAKLTTVLLMILVAAASVILTTLFGVAICYYISQRN
ncbi:uncharacterized protein TNIN_145911 [Trichonephila inaurata madagascariensis]|uniref:EGF-like domain-containing protein n=1 Tax=Trichonephila inaurata madagascariensis TaxID=2747483 RepID=A0A8X6XJV4_9ARAC|nr:uncharacterized protein TNIN_145911 [Trichonephila inaurata madagascariensis]